MRVPHLSVLALVAACATSTTDTSSTDETDATSDYPEAVVFDAVFGDVQADCGTTFEGLGTSGATAELRDLRFFVHDLRLSGPSGQGTIVMDNDGTWQNGRTGLLDFENGSGACAESGDSRTNDRIVGSIPEGDWDTLTFTIGVPFSSNHLDIVASEAPLDLSSMFWNWQTGHKFMRVDLQAQASPQPLKWNLHIGSAGCTSGSALDAPLGDCDRPNLATISVPYDPFEGDVVVLDLAQLFLGSNIELNTEGSPPGCMSDPLDTAECSPVFVSLGMIYATGECDQDCANQIAFTSR